MIEPTASTGACSADLSCSRCDLLVGLDGLHVTAVEEVMGRRGCDWQGLRATKPAELLGIVRMM